MQLKTIRWSRAVILALILGGLSLGDGRPQAPTAEGISRLMTAAGVPWRIRTSLSESVLPATGLGGALGWGENALDRGGAYDLCGLAVRPLDGEAAPAVIYRPEGLSRHWRARNRVVFPPMRAGDIKVSREVDVLEDSEICRWFDSFTNLANEPRTFEVVLYHGLGTGDRPLMAVSNVDGSIGSVADDGTVLVQTGWQGRGMGAAGVLGHIVYGADSRAPLLRADFGTRGPIYEPGLGSVAAAWVYRMTLAPGQRGIILNALAAGSNPDVIRAELRRHLDGRLLILNGLNREERGDIMNFNAALATTAWPQVDLLYPQEQDIIPTAFTALIHAADADKIVRMRSAAKSRSGQDWDMDGSVKEDLTQGASLDYNVAWTHCDFPFVIANQNLEVTVWNSAGQSAYDSAGYYGFFLKPPNDLRVRFTSPPGGPSVSGRTQVLVSLRTEVDAVLDILIDGRLQNRQSVLARKGLGWGTYSCIWDTTGYANGTHRLDAWISDYEGHSEYACGFSVDVFNLTPPSVTIDRPSNGAVVHGAVGISAQARDDVRVVSLALLVDGKTVAEAHGNTSTLAAQGEWDSTETANGMHEITALARDDEGSEGSSLIRVEVKNISLAIEVSSDVERAWLIKKLFGKIKLTIENLAGLDGARFVLLRSADGAAFQSIQEVPAADVSGNTHTFNDLTIQKGHTYSYRVEAYDAAGAKIGRSAEVSL
jgi:hypothetical protein